MTHQADFVKLDVTDGWIACPHCRRNRRLKRIFPDEDANLVALHCKDCKQYIYVKIHGGQCFESRCPGHSDE